MFDQKNGKLGILKSKNKAINRQGVYNLVGEIQEEWRFDETTSLMRVKIVRLIDNIPLISLVLFLAQIKTRSIGHFYFSNVLNPQP